MIPEISKTAARWIIIGLAVATVLAGFMAVKSCSDRQAAATREKLAVEQKGAALQSGKDAVETLGNATAREGNIHDTVKEGSDEIAKAPPGDSNAAADRAACRLRAYRNTSKCVALLGPVAE